MLIFHVRSISVKGVASIGCFKFSSIVEAVKFKGIQNVVLNIVLP